jgi:hypothetical protein
VLVFSRYQDLKKWELWDTVIGVIVNAEDRVPSRDVSEKAVLFCYLSLTWDVSRLIRDQDANKPVTLSRRSQNRPSLPTLGCVEEAETPS